MITPVSDKKIEANRLNAQRSTGPRSEAGKLASSRNATRHAVFARDVLLPGEDPQELKLLREDMLRSLNPGTALELHFVEQAISIIWRQRRLRRAEVALYAELGGQYSCERLGVGRNGAPALTHPAWNLYRMLQRDVQGLKLCQLYEQRLNYALHRCLGQIRQLRKDGSANELSELTTDLLEQEELDADKPGDAAPVEAPADKLAQKPADKPAPAYVFPRPVRPAPSPWAHVKTKPNPAETQAAKGVTPPAAPAPAGRDSG